MQKNSRYTKWEHFVPRVYYKGFSDIKQKKSKEKLLVWALDVKSIAPINKQVDVENFCAKDNLYELRNKEGEVIAHNIIEKSFGKIEAEVGKVLKKIKEKSQNEKCLECMRILSEDDKSILIILITMLQFRDPETIDYGIKILQRDNPEMDDREARNFTLMNLLPLGIDPEWDKNTIIRSAVEKYSGMEFQIGIAPDDLIITSDRPVIEWPLDKNELFNRPRAVMFPLTSRLVLYLFPILNNQQMGRSFFFCLKEAQIRDIQIDVAVSARRWIFSRNAITDEQLARIREGRSRWNDAVI